MIAAAIDLQRTAAHVPAPRRIPAFPCVAVPLWQPRFSSTSTKLVRRDKGGTHPRVFLCKSVDLLENKGVVIFDKHKERKEFVIE